MLPALEAVVCYSAFVITESYEMSLLLSLAEQIKRF